MSLDQLWRELETGDPSLQPGVLIRRFDPETREGLFVGLRQPSGTRLLLLQLDGYPRPDDGVLLQSRGFRTELQRFSTEKPGVIDLYIEAVDASYNPVFAILAEDVAHQVTHRSVGKSAASAFLDRLHRWKRFFESATSEGLGESSALGLQGELLFLRDFALRENINHDTAVRSWFGPEPLNKDFQYPDFAAEIKCSASREHAKIHVSGEEQLDNGGFEHMYLVVFLMEHVGENGESLPDVVAGVRQVLRQGSARSDFEDRLVAAGYLDDHGPRYARWLYRLQRVRVFQVRDGFPRLTPPLPGGVGDLTYSIALSSCSGFETDQEQIRDRLRALKT